MKPPLRTWAPLLPACAIPLLVANMTANTATAFNLNMSLPPWVAWRGDAIETRRS